ncbi:hypothetical protein QZH41_020534 [Actinostola sp. cb2023]|nr:hypothetical protein QZH41_020534 [Actinostola sp. cb2023]
MDSKQFRKSGKQLIDFIADYFENIEECRVIPDVKPGFLLEKLPSSAPKHGEDFSKIFEDYQRHVMPGVSISLHCIKCEIIYILGFHVYQWNSPHFHGLFPCGVSYPSILGELLAAATGGVGFSWAVNPSSTELEIVVTEWLGKIIGLPKEFLAMNPQQGSDGERGGGVIQGSASESVLVTMLAARKATLDRLKETFPDELEHAQMGKLVAYSSKLTHASIEKAALICTTKLHLIETDDQGVIDTALLTETIQLCANLGTTVVCSFDNLEDLGPISKRWDMWLHVDAAYAGTFFLCPEFRTYLKGIEFADSFNFNAHKLMLTNFDCSPLWVKDRNALMNALSVDMSYFKNDDTGAYKWQIPLGRRFRSLKLWFVLRSYGLEGLQRHVREAHSSIEKAALICSTKLRLIETDDQGVIDTALLTKTIQFCATLGTTVTCSFDSLEDIGPICVVSDFRKWQIPLGRRFRSLKLWFVLRSYGLEGLQRHVREHLQRKTLFEDLVAQDARFEFWPRKPNLGLVCFRLKGPDKLTKMLTDSINNGGKISLSAVLFKNKTIMRFHGGVGTTERHVQDAWNVIQNETDLLLRNPNISSL